MVFSLLTEREMRDNTLTRGDVLETKCVPPPCQPAIPLHLFSVNIQVTVTPRRQERGERRDNRLREWRESQNRAFTIEDGLLHPSHWQLKISVTHK